MAATDYKTLLDPAQIKRDLEINMVDINHSLMRQPGLFAHYATLAARFDRDVNKYDQFTEVIAAKLDREIRDQAAADGVKYTETQIKSRVAMDPRMIAAQQRLNEAREAASIAKSTAEAFRHRRDMLEQIAYNLREEAKGQMQISGDPNIRRSNDIRAARAESFLRDINH